MRKGYLEAAVSAALFGTAGVIIKLAFKEGTDSINLLILQYIIAVLIMFFIMLMRSRASLKISLKELYHCLILGVVGNTLMTVFYYMAFDYLKVSLVTVLLYTNPIIIFIYSIVADKTEINKSKVASIFIAFIGCLMTSGALTSKGELSLIGILCGILAAIFYAFMNIYSSKKLEHTDSLAINMYSTIFSLLSLLIYRPPVFLAEGKYNLKLIFFTGLLAVFCEIAPLTLLYSSIKRIGSLKVSIIGNLEIPVAIVISYLTLGEGINLIQLLGACMVVYAAYTVQKIK